MSFNNIADKPIVVCFCQIFYNICIFILCKRIKICNEQYYNHLKTKLTILFRGYTLGNFVTAYINLLICVLFPVCVYHFIENTWIIFQLPFWRSSCLFFLILEHSWRIVCGSCLSVTILEHNVWLSFSRILWFPYTPNPTEQLASPPLSLHITSYSIFTQNPNTLCHATTPFCPFNSPGRIAFILNCIFLSNLWVWYHFRPSFSSHHPLTLKWTKKKYIFSFRFLGMLRVFPNSCFHTHYLTVTVHVVISVFERV